MITIVVVDISAESRNRISHQISSILRSAGGEDLTLVPRTSIKPLSPYELKFHAAPDVCVIGEELASSDASEVGRIRKLLPDSALLVRLSRDLYRLNTVDQLARLGADDVFSEDVSSHDFLRKLVLLARKRRKEKTGTLIVVDGAKGGVGVTSIVAAMGEALLNAGKSCALVDLDIETQDLSRFLQARPFINENLRLLLDGERPVSDECVSQCLVPIWEGEEKVRCVPPAPESDDLYEGSGEHARTWMSILEVLDERFDFVLVDLGCARGALRKTLYRVADKVVFVVNNDPAALFASVDKVNKARALLSAGSELVVLQNGSTSDGIASGILREEFMRASQLEERQWIAEEIPYCRQGRRWPGSGATLLSQGKATVGRGIECALVALGIMQADSQENRSLLGLVRNYSLKLGLGASAAKPAEQSLPAPVKRVAIDQETKPRVALPAPAEIPSPQLRSSPEPRPATNTDFIKGGSLTRVPAAAEKVSQSQTFAHQRETPAVNEAALRTPLTAKQFSVDEMEELAPEQLVSKARLASS